MFERRGAVDDGEQLVDPPAVHDRHRDDLLCEDVERVARQRVSSIGPSCTAGDHRGLEQVAAVLREDDALARFADPVTGAAYPL